MARKTGTLDQQKQSVRRGKASKHEIVSDANLPEFERNLKQEMLVILKAAHFSHSYCADALGVSRSTITTWLGDEELNLAEAITKTHEKMVASGVKLIQSYVIEIIEILMGIVRTTESEERAVKIAFEFLDRVGIAKVNKSESVTAATVREEREVDIVDRTGILEIVKNAPPEVQSAMATQLQDLISLASEHRETVPAAKETDNNA